VRDRESVERAVGEADVVVHLAALTKVDACEKDPGLAHSVNALGTANVAGACAENGVPLIYLSTDYVFDGNKPTPYEESDHPAPRNAYGRSKLEGERYVAELEDWACLRTSWVFGDGHNFIRSVLSSARQGKPLRVVDDQRGRPTAASDLARAIDYVISERIQGTVHVTGTGPSCTWADLAAFVLSAASVEVPLKRVTTKEYAATAPEPFADRPPNSMLSLSLAESIGIPLTDWRTAVGQYIGALG
jgi:dTDP-4-dehydrorhamnose reductase